MTTNDEPKKGFLDAALRAVKRTWVRLGTPLPGPMRFVRHTLLKKWLPSRDPRPANRIADVSVIITSHNYGHYLKRAIESILAQDVQPRTILVLDDCSEDDTGEIARRYADRGVVYVRGEWDDISRTRNAGALMTQSLYLLFVDADDYLPPQYIARCLECMRQGKDVAITYGDIQECGATSTLYTFETFSAEAFDRMNCISSHALILRQAFDLVGGYRTVEAPEDWDLYKRILKLGFRAVHAPTFVYHTVHPTSRVFRLLAGPKGSYDGFANLMGHPIMIFTHFTGRADIFDRYLAALKKLACDPAFIQLHWYNTSDDAAFDARLKAAMTQLPFARLSYVKDPPPALWNTSPKDPKHGEAASERALYLSELSAVRAYNVMLQTCTADFILTIADDIAPAPDALIKMLAMLDRNVVAVVASQASRASDPAGNFRCTLFRSKALEKMPIYTGITESPLDWYDHLVFERLAKEGKIVFNKNIAVEHLGSKERATAKQRVGIHAARKEKDAEVIPI
jgi:glycosyltransferase involved in cell wall biosynthesis